MCEKDNESKKNQEHCDQFEALMSDVEKEEFHNNH